MNQGWTCPKCGAVMAPFVPLCVNCKGNAFVVHQPWQGSRCAICGGYHNGLPCPQMNTTSEAGTPPELI